MRFLYHVLVGLSIAVLFSPFALGRTGSNDTFILTIDRVKEAVVPILCGRFDEKGAFSVQLIDGTGFFIDDDSHFVTAAHVINDLTATNPQRPIPCVTAVYIPDKKWEREAIDFSVRWFLFNECRVDNSLDLAVCKTVDKVPVTIHPLIINDSRLPDGAPVAFTGFPLGTVEPLSSRCNIATYRGAVNEEGSRDVILDKGTWPGASGSPIYDEGGAVIGIVLARGTADSVGTAFGRPSHFIAKFLRDSSISVKAAKDKPTKRKK